MVPKFSSLMNFETKKKLIVSFFWNYNIIYSVSCDLSAAPAPGQIAGSGTRPVLIEIKRSNTGTEKYSSWPSLGRYWLVLFGQWKPCVGTGTLSYSQKMCITDTEYTACFFVSSTGISRKKFKEKRHVVLGIPNKSEI